MANTNRTQEIVRSYIDRKNDQLDAALRDSLTEPIVLEPGRRLQFEVDPWSQGIHLCATEAIIMEDHWLMDGLLKDFSDDLLEEALEVVNEMVLNWLAEAWQRVGGPERYRPAFAFLHGYQEQFDMEQRRWLSVEKAFGVRPNAEPIIQSHQVD